MDAIASVVAESAALASGPANAQLGYASVYDVGAFRAAWDRASVDNPPPAAAVDEAAKAESEGLRNLFTTLDSLNGRAESLESKASVFTEGQRDMTPGDMLMLTVHAHEFLFHCSITANVANRTSDGIQQLFRQQA